MKRNKGVLLILLKKWSALGWDLYFYNFTSLVLKQVEDDGEYYLSFDQSGFCASNHFGESLKISPKEFLLAAKTMKEIKS